LEHINIVDNIGGDSMSGGKNVDNFWVKNLILTKCQSLVTHDTIPFPHFRRSTSYHSPPHFVVKMDLTIWPA